MIRNRSRSPHSILITGASSGIGAALARRYASPGVHLALGGRAPDRLATVAAECRQAGATVREQSVDVTDRAALATWIAEADRDAPLDLVIANAGTAGRHLPHGPDHDQRRAGRGDHRARSRARPGADRVSTCHVLGHARARHPAPGPGRLADAASSDGAKRVSSACELGPGRVSAGGGACLPFVTSRHCATSRLSGSAGGAKGPMRA